MTFHQKSALIMTGLLIVVFGWYFALVLGTIAHGPARDVAYTAVLIVVVVLLTMLVTASHIVIALVSRADGSEDERDRMIVLRSERAAGYVLAIGVFAGIGLAIVRADTFWIAQALIAALVLAEITDGIIKLVLYRRGV
jgi:hypothetical protein